ncbi:site-specific integrase [Flagellimonas algicola]|uniref:Site-specific integrase n=1 Tax=Flagellimonas algicola TaxID=2583815 RepID=A0ABY2WGT8_9FLAO|nr:site-specific integrase [Allomuricauda algicola]TMU50782.1 site-specific integrase [Allomuricauda algicola]
MRTKTTFSILFWLYTKRIDANGQASIYARVSLNGKKLNISLKQKIKVDQWDSERQRIQGTNAYSKRTNNLLDEIRAELFQIYRELQRGGKIVTAQLIKAHFLGENKDQYTLLDLFKFHNETLANKLAPKTLCHYRTNQKYVLAYVDKRFSKKDLYLNELDYSFVLDFESFLRSYRPDHYRKRIANNAVMKHIQRFRKQVRLAVDLEWLEKDPFKKFKPQMEKREREFLTDQELLRIHNLKTPIERLSIVKDLFVFSCYTGISYSDIVSLTIDNLILGPDGKKWISAKRQKNGTPFKVPLLEPSLQLINKYLGHPRTKLSGTLLPRISNQKLNSYLKEIADLCEVSKNLTFHMARHTFATTVTLSNGVPIETVSKILGHTRLATTQIYARVLDKKIGDDMDQLREKLIKKKKI